jgi:hypothetical protein
MLWGLKITDLAGCVQADIPVGAVPGCDVDMDWDDPTDVCGACGSGGQGGCTPGCHILLEVESQWAGYQLQLAAEQEEQAAQQAAVAYQIGTRQEAAARAAFWRLWKTPYERVKRVRPANQRDDVQWC